jgi:hypothetical protein
MCLKERSEIPSEAIAAYEEEHKAVNRRILDRVACDPEFKERLLENPRQALEEAGIAGKLATLGATGHHHDQGSAVCCDYYSSYWHE